MVPNHHYWLGLEWANNMQYKRETISYHPPSLNDLSLPLHPFNVMTPVSPRPSTAAQTNPSAHDDCLHLRHFQIILKFERRKGRPVQYICGTSPQISTDSTKMIPEEFLLKRRHERELTIECAFLREGECRGISAKLAGIQYQRKGYPKTRSKTKAWQFILNIHLYSISFTTKVIRKCTDHPDELIKNRTEAFQKQIFN